MFNVFIQQSAHQKITLFIDYLQDQNYQRFSDTGLFAESAIRSFYLSYTQALSDKIYQTLESLLSTNLVYGRRQDPEHLETFTCITRVDNYLLILDYKEDDEQQARFVYDIKIMR